MSKNPHAVALGRLGGLAGGAKGGHARARALSARRRREIAANAAGARWGRLPDSLRPLFWSYRFGDLRLPRDENLVLLHALAYGHPEHVVWLRQQFGDTAIRQWITRRQGKGLTVEQMSPWIPASTARRWQASNPGAVIWLNR